MTVADPFRKPRVRKKSVTIAGSLIGKRNILVNGKVVNLKVYRGIDKDYVMIDDELKMIKKTRKKVDGKLILWEVV